MPAQESAFRNQKAVLWPRIEADDYGHDRVGDPEEIDVRWNTTRTETLDAQGNAIALDATVVVNQRIAVGSNMWLGEIDSWTGTGSAGNATEIMEVKTYKEVPDLKNREVYREVGLMRFRDEPATV